MSEPGVVQLTEKAAEHIRTFLADRPELPPLRLAVVRTHCMQRRGYAYDLRVADDRGDQDVVAESRGVTFLMDPESARLARGVRLDFLETEFGSSFDVRNPNAVGKCPCGHHDLFA